MKSFAIKGAILALFGAFTIGLGHLLGLELDQVAFLGVALGAVIGLVPDRSQTERIVGFLAGFVLAWIGYAVRAAVLPDTGTGLACRCGHSLSVRPPWSVPTNRHMPLRQRSSCRIRRPLRQPSCLPQPWVWLPSCLPRPWVWLARSCLVTVSYTH